MGAGGHAFLARPTPTSGRVLPQLDALRGVAILAVFAQHFGDRFMPFVEGEVSRALPKALAPWLLTVVYHAHWGVDLFFVLSGFSLAQGYIKAFDRNLAPKTARAFLLRRAARILPAYYVAVAVVLASHPMRFARPEIGRALAAHALVLQGYVTPGDLILIGATWSLTTEIGFYLLLPLFARPLLERRGGRRGWILGGALCFAAWASRAALHAAVLEPGVRTALLELTQRRLLTSRLDQFVLGAMAAAVHADLERAGLALRAARVAPLGIAVGAVALVIGFRLEGELYLSPGGSWPYAIISLATAALVLGSVVGDVATPAPLRAVGVVSYGVFLFHQQALGLVSVALPGSGWGKLAENAALALTLSIGVGAASWVLIERRAMRLLTARR
jgi:peptidoglycan/LPS O-acetylase OafA/YrhL